MFPQPEDSGRTPALEDQATAPALTAESSYSAEERSFLIRLAHDAIISTLEHRQAVVGVVSERLKEKCGAFTTLYLEGEVRGCVGYVYPVVPLVETVIETARAAAFQDTRFLPVTPDEAQHLKIEISVLSTLAPIRAEQIELGRHGLLVTLGNHRGLLLPQVPIEHGWDRRTFLEQICRKAGLPLDSWQKGAQLEAFTAEIFGEHPLAAV